MPRVLVSHPSSVPAAASLPLARSSCRGSAVPFERGRQEAPHPASATHPFPKGLCWEGSLKSQIFGKRKKEPHSSQIPFPSQGALVGALVWTDSGLSLSSEHRFFPAGTVLPWHQNAQVLCPALQMAQPSHAQGNALGCSGAILTPPPQGYDLLPQTPPQIITKDKLPPKGVKQNSAPHPSSIPEPHSTKPLYPAL